MAKPLVYNDSLKEVLVNAVVEILSEEKVTIGKRFESWDSFSFLITSNYNKKYVAKIFRFPEWPPLGKLEAVSKLLIKNNIRHENVLHIVHSHIVFTHGWLLSEFVDGGTAKEAIDTEVISKQTYYKEIGRLLKQTHSIDVDYFGSIHKDQNRHQTFLDMALEELSWQKFDKEHHTLKKYEEIIDQVQAQIKQALEEITQFKSTLVHDDVGTRNVLWKHGDPILIDWVDSVAGPPIRDFATITYRENGSILSLLEEGYEKKINRYELKLHQLMRFLRLGHFYLYEDKDVKEFKIMMDRANVLLNQEQPFGA